MLSANWIPANTGNITPTFIDVNSSVGEGQRAGRAEIRVNDTIMIRSDVPSLIERPIGTWHYGHRTSRVLVEPYTATSRQQLYDIMLEIRRICHSQLHALTDYQRVQFISMNELVDENLNQWVGKILIELLNSAVFLEGRPSV